MSPKGHNILHTMLFNLNMYTYLTDIKICNPCAIYVLK